MYMNYTWPQGKSATPPPSHGGGKGAPTRGPPPPPPPPPVAPANLEEFLFSDSPSASPQASPRVRGEFQVMGAGGMFLVFVLVFIELQMMEAVVPVFWVFFGVL